VLVAIKADLQQGGRLIGRAPLLLPHGVLEAPLLQGQSVYKQINDAGERSPAELTLPALDAIPDFDLLQEDGPWLSPLKYILKRYGSV
jgi:hypothetical protein